MRTPRLTLVSDGKPRRRLLIGSKKGIFKSFVAHDRSSFRIKILRIKKLTRFARETTGESKQNRLNEVLVQTLRLQ